MFDQEEFAALTRPLGQSLIEYVPEHFRSAFCVVGQAPKHSPGRLHYRIGCDDFPDEGTSRPSPPLHDAVYAIARFFEKQGESFPGLDMRVAQSEGGAWKFSMQIGRTETPLPTEERESALWQEVYEARERLYREHVGEFPEYIQKIMPLTGVWPGGGLFQIENSKIGGACVTTSFGLSNPDMPTSSRATNTKRSVEGDAVSFSSTLEGRTPRWVEPGVAGYGYEIVLLTRRPEPWAANLVSWAVNAEILNDVDMLDRVRDIGAVTVEDLSLGDGRTADFLIAPAAPPLPPRLELPNGTMSLLVMTRITRPEMTVALAEGQRNLAARLTAAGVGQVSDLERKSIV